MANQGNLKRQACVTDAPAVAKAIITQRNVPEGRPLYGDTDCERMHCSTEAAIKDAGERLPATTRNQESIFLQMT